MAGDLNLDEALCVAGNAYYDAHGGDWDEHAERVVRKTVEAALPHILEAAAQKILDSAREIADTDTLDAVVGMLTARVIVTGEPYPDDQTFVNHLSDVLGDRGQNRVTYVVHLSEELAATAIVRGSGENHAESAAISSVTDQQPADGLGDTKPVTARSRALSEPSSTSDGEP